MSKAKNRPSHNGETIQLATRVPREFSEIIDRYVEYFNLNKECKKVKRGDVVRDLLQSGLDQLKKTTPLDGGK